MILDLYHFDRVQSSRDIISWSSATYLLGFFSYFFFSIRVLCHTAPRDTLARDTRESETGGDDDRLLASYRVRTHAIGLVIESWWHLAFAYVLNFYMLARQYCTV